MGAVVRRRHEGRGGVDPGARVNGAFRGAAASPPQTPPSSPRSRAPLSAGRALRALHELCEGAQRHLQDLKQEAELLRREVLRVRREKDRELMELQERLRMERQLALEALEGQLVQGWSKRPHSHPVHSPSPEGARFSSQRGFSTPRRLHHPQSWSRELQAENAAFFRGGLGSLRNFREHLGQTFRDRRHATRQLSSCPRHGTGSWE